MTEALYGPEGFYRRSERPAAHFRTSAHASPRFAGAVYKLIGESGLNTVVDVGAGGGELLTQLHALDPLLRLVGVEIADRPTNLPPAIEWAASLPERLEAFVIANEWLDNVPLDLVEASSAGLRLVLVDSNDGAERLGAPPTGDDMAWLEHWWPLGEPGTRGEVGRPRDEAWAAVIAALERGVAIAIDYGHTATNRPQRGSLAGYRGGRAVPPVPDGNCDITAHVAMDAVAAAGERAGAHTSRLTTQREALRRLGVDARRPDLVRAAADPDAYVRALARATHAAELLDPAGLGGFYWLEQRVGTA
jgi:SAM-dependent MidA family methyltransferase